jgi:hypothetical protein
MIEFRQNSRYKIQTPSGYQFFSGMRKTAKSEIVEIKLTDNTYFEASLDHRFVVGDEEILAKNIRQGFKFSINKEVESVNFKKGTFNLYDPVDVRGGSLFIADSLTSHNCSFLSSGETVVEPDDISFYETTYQQDPSDRRGVDGNLWVWEYPDYQKDYLVVADVARGDSADYSTFHVIDLTTVAQVAEFKSKVSPKEFGNILVGIAAEYNDALLVVENANIGWSTIEQIIERDYRNLYYSSNSTQDTVETYMSKFERDKLVPGFTMSLRTRPLVIAKMMEYIREKSCIIKSKRLLSELRVFVWKNGKAQAQTGYNDDLVMAFATGLYVRDTALRLRQQGQELTRAQMQSFLATNQRQPTITSVGSHQKNPYNMDTPYGVEDISWILK